MNSFDIRPLIQHAEASLAAQKVVHRLRQGKHPEIVWTACLELVDTYGLHPIPAASLISRSGGLSGEGG